MGILGQSKFLADIDFRIDLQRLASAARDTGNDPVAAILDVAVRTMDQRIRAMEEDEDESFATLTTTLCRNIRIDGKRTSIKLEKAFWHALEGIAERSGRSVNDLCCEAARYKGTESLASAVRVFILVNSQGLW